MYINAFSETTFCQGLYFWLLFYMLIWSVGFCTIITVFKPEHRKHFVTQNIKILNKCN